MYLVGLTGGIATGKSTVSSLFRAHGIPIIDADEIAKEILQPGEKTLLKIRARFGEEVFHGIELDRKKLAEIIFRDARARKDLNDITHPEIYKRIVCRIVKYFFAWHQFVILDLPLLFEKGTWLPVLDEIIVVSCTPEEQLQRLVHRNTLSESDALARINAQLPLYVKIKRATILINNSGSTPEEAALIDQVDKAVATLRSRTYHWRNRLLLATAGLSSLLLMLAFCRKAVNVLV